MGDRSGDDQGPKGGTAPRGPVDLFPTDVLARIAGEGTPAPASGDGLVGGGGTLRIPGPFRGHALRLPGPLELPPESEAQRDKNRLLALGPSYAALGAPPTAGGAGFFDHLVAEGALSLLPAALVAQTAKPAVDFAYGLIDRIPSYVRQPFEKTLGLLLDNALAWLERAATPVVAASVERFYPGGEGLPPRASVPIRAEGQIYNSCGDTAVAEILRANGIPVPVFGDVDAQAPYPGTSFNLDAEVRRRGLTVIGGAGDLLRLKAFLAAGVPVMVSVGWARGGGHIAVVSGYDQERRTLTVESWDGRGSDDQHVDEKTFAEAWARHDHQMTAVLPQRDPRLEPLLAAADPRRPTVVPRGLSLSNLWVSRQGKVYVEAAWRYAGPSTDVTVKVRWDQAESSLARQLGGALAIRQQLSADWFLGLEIQKVSLLYQEDDWRDPRRLPLSIYGTLSGPGVELKVGGERGGMQASLAIDLGRWVAGLGLRAQVSADLDGSYKVTAMLAGTF